MVDIEYNTGYSIGRMEIDPLLFFPVDAGRLKKLLKVMSMDTRGSGMKLTNKYLLLQGIAIASRNTEIEVEIMQEGPVAGESITRWRNRLKLLENKKKKLEANAEVIRTWGP